MQDESVAETDLVGLLWRRKLWLLLSVALGAALGYGLSQLQSVAYTAEARVFLAASGAFDPLDQRTIGNQERYVAQQAAIMTSDPVLERVTPPAGVDPEELAEALDVTASADSDLIVVQATAVTPEGAAGLADGTAAAYAEYTVEGVELAASRAVAAVTDSDQAEQIRAAAAVYDDGVALIDAAPVPTSPSQPAPLRNAVLLAVLAGLLCAALVVLADGRRPAARRRVPPSADRTSSGLDPKSPSTPGDLEAGEEPVAPAPPPTPVTADRRFRP